MMNWPPADERETVMTIMSGRCLTAAFEDRVVLNGELKWSAAQGHSRKALA